jgi:hypothetical protein
MAQLELTLLVLEENGLSASLTVSHRSAPVSRQPELPRRTMIC